MDLPKEKTNPMAITEKLLRAEQETEQQIRQMYLEKINGMVEKVKALLIAEGFTVKDWYAVTEEMNHFQANIISKFTLEKLYDQGNTKDTETEPSESDKQDVGGGQGEAPKEE